jgi:nitrite reductase/ring-hydroxylating ferredoxin subunit/uncharacterized membrane protein
MIKNFLQGKLLKPPLHPALVHFPIGLFGLSLLLDGINAVGQPDAGLARGSLYALSGGILMAFLAAIPGAVDWSAIRTDHPAKKIATTHMVLNLTAVGLNVLSAGIRASQLDIPATPMVPMGLSALAFALILGSGYLGGVLVYDHGMRVGRHRRETPPPATTIKLTSAAEDEFVAVPTAQTLHNQETLRIELDGQVMALVKLDGNYYAIQEFCTHRFGPLSEGSFANGQVECPWHRSCFDLRTGKVTQGPAKVDLKTYEVAVRAGQVWVRARPENTQQEQEREAG